VPRGKTQDGVQVAILHQDLEHLTSFAFEKTVVRKNDRGPTTRFKRVQYVLDEIELLVACLDSEVITVGGLIRAFCAKWWVREDPRRSAPRGLARRACHPNRCEAQHRADIDS